MSNTDHGKLYIGEAFYLDTQTKQIIARGYGQFDTRNHKFSFSVASTKTGTFRKTLIIVKSENRYLAPFALHTKTLISGMAEEASYTVRAFLRWNSDQNQEDDLAAPLQTYENIYITTPAEHAADKLVSKIHNKGSSSALIKRATSKQIAEFTHDGVRAAIFAGYATKLTAGRSRGEATAELNPQIRYRFTQKSCNFLLADLGKIILAFKLYWLSYFDTTDCAIESVRLGDSIHLHLANPHLRALSTSAPDYKASPNIPAEPRIDDLAKMAYFFLNPHRHKKLGASSKIGLSFSRLIDYRFRDEPSTLHANIIGLIFALQALAEAIAEKEIQRQHRADKQNIHKSIRDVQRAIKSMEKNLAHNVRDFYIRPEAEIYSLIARPTFKHSLNTALKVLNIDAAPYKSLLKSIDAARRQIVHSESYSVEFLLNFLTDTIVQFESGNRTSQPSTTYKNGDIENLYKLLRNMTKNYFCNIF